MPHENLKTNHAGAPTIAPVAPAEILCAPSETAPPDHPDHPPAPGATRDAKAAATRRTTHPPGRSLDEVMRAFREQRRITKTEGQAGAVIAHIVAQTGQGSLLSDLTGE